MMVVELTSREDQVAYLMKIRDLSQVQVAAALGISVRTVERHVASIRRKTGSTTTAAALSRARPRGLGLSVETVGFHVRGIPS